MLRSEEKDKEESTTESEAKSDLESSSASDESGRLGDDEFFLIFSYLKMEDLLKVEQVCCRWSQIVVRYFEKKRKLTFTNFDNFPINSALTIIKGCGSTLGQLQLDGLDILVNDDVIKTIVDCCPNLEEVNFSDNDISDESVKSLTLNCDQLKVVKLADCPRLTDDGLRHLMSSSTSLKELDISISSKLVGECFSEMSPQLEKITLCKQASKATIDKVLDKFVHLHELRLFGNFRVCQKEFKKFCEESKSIKRLQISLSAMPVEIFLEISKLKSLEELALAHNRFLDDDAIMNIVRGCPNLRSLDTSSATSRVTGSWLNQSAQYCKQLEKLDISNMKKDYVLDLNVYGRFDCLKVLIANDTPLTTNGCINMVDNSPRLELMNISGCKNVFDRFVTHCLSAVQLRDSLPLKLIVGGSGIRKEMTDKVEQHPLLVLDFSSSSFYEDEDDDDSLSDSEFDYCDSYDSNSYYDSGDYEDYDYYAELYDSDYLYGGKYRDGYCESSD